MATTTAPTVSQLRTDARTLGIPFNSANEPFEYCIPCMWGALHGLATVVGNETIAARADGAMADIPHTH